MKNSKFIKLTILSMLPTCLAVGIFSGIGRNVKEVSAYSSYTENTLPTTIDLNVVEDNEIRNYYSGLNSLSESELNGTNLLKNLKPILKNNQKYFSYDSTSPKNAIWKAYEIVDRDWNLSPAKDISGYNSTTGIITGYTYKASTEFDDSKNPYLHALYANRDLPNEIKAWGNHNQVQGGINQEHIWPKSHGFDTSGAGGARGDLMHLWAADGYSNKIHSNYSYGFVDKTKSFDCTVNTVTYATDNFLGISKTLGEGTVFEPQDSDKGDIARALFYMAARYNNYAGASEGIDSDDPNLILDDSRSLANQKGYTSTISVPGNYGVLSDLLEWNRLDPVDEFEKHRNDLLYRNYTKNRNPFIDFPEWAELIWGENQTGIADPTKDKINENLSEEAEEEPLYLKATKDNPIIEGDKIAIVCEGVNMQLSSISKTSTKYGLGEVFDNNINELLIFDVVPTEDNYLFVNNGKYLSQFTSGNGLFLSDTINDLSTWSVVFDDSGNTKISTIEDSPRSILWNVNSPRFAAYVNYESKITPKTDGSFSYYPIQIYKKNLSHPVEGISLDAEHIELEVGKSAQLTPAFIPNNAVDKRVNWFIEDETIANIDNGVISALKIGETVITAKTKDGGFTAQCSIKVVKVPEVVSLEIGGDFKTLYEQNEEYSEDGLLVIAHLDNGKDIDVTPEAEFSEINTSFIGEKTLTASYGGKSVSTKIYVATATFNLDSSLNVENGTEIETDTISGVTYTFSKGSGSFTPKYYTDGDATRLYAGNTLKFSCTDKIVKIILSFGKNDGINEITSTIGDFNTDTWSGRSNEVTLTIAGSSGHRRISKISVVTDPVPELHDISVSGVTTEYQYNEEFNFDGVITATYTNGATKSVTPTSVTSPSMTTRGEQTIVVSYTEDGITKTASYTITITRELTSIALSNFDSDIPFMSADGELTLTPTLIATFKDGGTETVEPDESNFVVDTTTLGEKEISASFEDKEVTEKVFITNNGAENPVITKPEEEKSAVITAKTFTANETKTVGDLDLTLKNSSTYFGNYDADKGQQFGSKNNAASEMTISTYTSESVSKIVVETSGASSVSASISVKVGQTSFTCGGAESVAISSTNTAYTFVGTGKGLIVITWNQTSSLALYFKSLTITVPEHDDYKWSGTDQAEAWCNYFVSLTGSTALGSGPCSLLTFNERKAALQDIWDKAKEEYEYMLNDSKDAFCDNLNSSLVSQVREHYLYIVQTYGLEAFVTDGEENVLSSRGGNFITLFNNNIDNSTAFAIILTFISTVTIAGFVIIKKRKVQ